VTQEQTNVEASFRKVVDALLAMEKISDEELSKALSEIPPERLEGLEDEMAKLLSVIEAKREGATSDSIFD